MTTSRGDARRFLTNRLARFARSLSLGVVTLHGSVTVTFAAEVIVDGDSVPQALFDAFVHDREHSRDRCPPGTASRYHAAFVRMVLQARSLERAERARLERELRPLIAKHARLTRLRDAQPATGRIGEVYERMRARMDVRIEALRAASDATLARHGRLHDPDGLNLPEDTPLETRHRLADRSSLQSEYRRAVERRIADADIVNRYDAMIEAGDPRLVDVHFFETIAIYAFETSATRVARIRERFEQGASADELRSTGNVLLSDSIGVPRWKRFEDLRLPAGTTPSELRRGDVLVSEVEFTYPLFRHVLIVDRRHRSRLPLDAPDLSGRSPRAIVRDAERRVRLDDDYRALLGRHEVTIDGVAFDEPAHPGTCGDPDSPR